MKKTATLYLCISVMFQLHRLATASRVSVCQNLNLIPQTPFLPLNWIFVMTTSSHHPNNNHNEMTSSTPFPPWWCWCCWWWCRWLNRGGADTERGWMEKRNAAGGTHAPTLYWWWCGLDEEEEPKHIYWRDVDATPTKYPPEWVQSVPNMCALSCIGHIDWILLWTLVLLLEHLAVLIVPDSFTSWNISLPNSLGWVGLGGCSKRCSKPISRPFKRPEPRSLSSQWVPSSPSSSVVPSFPCLGSICFCSRVSILRLYRSHSKGCTLAHI